MRDNIDAVKQWVVAVLAMIVLVSYTTNERRLT